MSKLDELIQELCPDGVEYKPFFDIAKYIRGVTYNKSCEITDGSDGYKLLRANNITLANNSLNLDDIKTINFGVKVKDEQFLQKDDILICAGSGSKEHIGKVAFISEDMQYTFGGFMGVIRANIKFISPRYLYHILTSKMFKEHLYKISDANSTTINNINNNTWKKFFVPIPPLEVQKEIVRLLDDFTAKTAELQNKINEELEARKKQYECYKDMLLNNSENFIITTIGNISESVTVGIANSATQAYSETGVTMLRNQNIKENYLDDNDLIYINNDFSMKYKNKSLKENDILVTRTGYPGVACVVPKKYENAQTFTTLIVRLQDLKKTNPKYVCYYINSLSGKQYVRKMQSGAAQQNFGATALSKMPINIPDITTQNYIVNIFENFDSTHSKISMALLSELESRQKQYEYYRDKLLTFKELK